MPEFYPSLQMCYFLFDLWSYELVDEKTRPSLPLAGAICQHYTEIEYYGESLGKFTDAELRGEYKEKESV